MSNQQSSDIFEREREIFNLFKTQDIQTAANFLCDFVKDFDDTRDRQMDCISFCNRASTISVYEKRKRFRDFEEFQDKVTSLLYDMMELLNDVMDQLRQTKVAA